MGGFYSDPSYVDGMELDPSQDWRRDVCNLKNQKKLLYQQLARRKMPGRRARIITRIQKCDVQIVELTLAHS